MWKRPDSFAQSSVKRRMAIALIEAPILAAVIIIFISMMNSLSLGLGVAFDLLGATVGVLFASIGGLLALFMCVLLPWYRMSLFDEEGLRDERIPLLFFMLVFITIVNVPPLINHMNWLDRGREAGADFVLYTPVQMLTFLPLLFILWVFSSFPHPAANAAPSQPSTKKKPAT